MKLSKKNMVVISFMLFSLFFGAGNLIFPPFLGQNAGEHTFTAMAGFLLTAVVLPVLGVIEALNKANDNAIREDSTVCHLVEVLPLLASG